jgi:hypothetical protein
LPKFELNERFEHLGLDARNSLLARGPSANHWSAWVPGAGGCKAATRIRAALRSSAG